MPASTGIRWPRPARLLRSRRCGLGGWRRTHALIDAAALDALHAAGVEPVLEHGLRSHPTNAVATAGALALALQHLAA